AVAAQPAARLHRAGRRSRVRGRSALRAARGGAASHETRPPARPPARPAGAHHVGSRAPGHAEDPMRLVHERASRSPIASREGAAYVEFLLAFMPLFVLFLGIVQVSLLFAADLVVKHAAYRATRAA